MKKLKNLFLRQSCLDSWEDYERSLRKHNFIKWDYLVLTASNEMQAAVYREQIDERLQKGLLPAETKYAVLPDPGGKRVGSGGATFQVLKYIAEQENGAYGAYSADCAGASQTAAAGTDTAAAGLSGAETGSSIAGETAEVPASAPCAPLQG